MISLAISRTSLSQQGGADAPTSRAIIGRPVDAAVSRNTVLMWMTFRTWFVLWRKTMAFDWVRVGAPSGHGFQILVALTRQGHYRHLFRGPGPLGFPPFPAAQQTTAVVRPID